MSDHFNYTTLERLQGPRLTHRVVVVDNPGLLIFLLNVELDDVGVRIAGHILGHVILQFQWQLRNIQSFLQTYLFYLFI